METISSYDCHLLSPTNTLDTMASPQNAPTFLKLEDLDNTPSSLSSSYDDGSSVKQATPPQVIVHSKPAKKRKSWGQELPEPKTTLPPRKRAKTDDEKEQRRIERIKRNRAAAHNSRERKRQETDVLAVALARANAELEAYRKLFGALPSNVVLPEVMLSTDSADTPAPSLGESSRMSMDATSVPPTPNDSPLQTIKEEPAEMTLSTNVPLFDNFMEEEAKPTFPRQLDQTRHSAAMLCDLQCRSTCLGSPSSSSSNTSSSRRQISSSTAATMMWTNLFLYLMTIQLQSGYRAILLALWTHSPSRITRVMQAASTTRRLTSPLTTSSTTTPSWLPPTLAVAQRNAATGLVRRQQGAPLLAALRRRSLLETRQRRTTAAAAEQQCQTRDLNMALREQGRKRHRESDESEGDGARR